MSKKLKLLLPDSMPTGDFAVINNKILNYALLITVLFSIPAMIGMYFRLLIFNFKPLILFQLCLVILLIIVYLTKNKINFRVRFISFLSFLITLMFLYAVNFGMLGFWSINVVFISLIISVFYKKKYAFIVLIFLSIIISIAAFLFHNKYIIIDFNALVYINSYNIWVAMIITFIYISVISIFVVSIQRDYFITTIHQLINANEKVELNEKKFKNIFNASTDAFVISNFEGKIIEVNTSMLNFIGENEEVLKNKSLYDYILPEYQKTVKDMIMSLLKLKVLPLYEILVKNNKNEVVPVELNTILIAYNNKNAIFSVVRDITERKKVEQKILNTIIQTEEKERCRFAKEIHDGVGPLLSATKIYAKALQKADNEDELKYILSKLNETVDEAITSAQEIANNISPHILQNFGLKEAIKSFYQKIGKTSPVEFNFKTNLNERLDINIETTLYRLVAEMINNTIKYAGANSISIILMKENGNITLIYSDDGIGFDFKKTLENNAGMGLSNIESRIKSLDGQMLIQSEKQKGFRVEIKISL